MMKLLALCSVALLFTLVPSFNLQAHVNEVKHDHILITFINKAEEYRGDTSALKEYLTPLREELLKVDKTAQLVVYYTLMGSATSQQIGKVNDTSSGYFGKALELAVKDKDEALLLWVRIAFAEYYYRLSHLELAFPYFMDASFKIDDIPFHKQIAPDHSYKALGYFFGTLGEYKDAIYYLQKAVHLARENSVEKVSYLYNLANYTLAKKDTAVAIAYLTDAQGLALKIGAKSRLAKVYGTFAQISLGRLDYSRALGYIQQDIDLSIKSEDFNNLAFAEVLKARILSESKRYEEAKLLLEKVSKDILGAEEREDLRAEIAGLKLNIAQAQGDKELELESRRYLSMWQDSLQTGEAIQVIQRVRALAAKQKHRNESEINALNTQQQRFVKRIYIVVFALALGIIVISYFNFRRRVLSRYTRYEKNVLAYRLEKALLDSKLERTNQSLQEQIDYLSAKNKQIEGLQREINRIHKTRSASIEERNGKLKQLLHSHILTEGDWLNFKISFEKEYPNYYAEIRRQTPSLTENNMRFILLHKLGLSPGEIANVLGISLEAIKKNKQRLKQKLGDYYEQTMELL